MSYIIKTANDFASTKLTETGREKLAKGQLTFDYWTIGDSELNYTREELLDSGDIFGESRILRPKDKQPNLRYVISSGNNSPLNAFASGDIRCIKAVVNNEAIPRGTINDSGEDKTSIDDKMSDYIVGEGQLASLSGGNTLPLGIEVSKGDFILLKVGTSDFTNVSATPHLWFKASDSGTTVTVDRNLPTIGTPTAFIVYKGGETYDNEENTMAYWDTGTLSFTESCSISTIQAPIWNLNQPFSENILGITGTTEYEKLDNFGSFDYIGEKNNYLFGANEYKSVGIVHYTNKTISNQYGEFLYIDDSKQFKIKLPNIMYHRALDITPSMTFISDSVVKTVGTSGLNYVDLIEDVTLLYTGATAKVVGRVYHELKIIVFTDPEILATMSYKSNRNWTLPKMSLTPVNPSGGTTGPLGVGQTIYLTYSLDNNTGTGILPALPAQDYSKYTNNGALPRDIQFHIEDYDGLTFMMDSVSATGFYGDTLKVMYQITDGERPTTANWKVIDFSPSGMISKDYLREQNPLIASPIFQISEANDTAALQYSIIDTLNMSISNDPDSLQFGDERFFYGNIETNIGATIYKTLFKITINASDFNTTTNITRGDNPSVIKVSEVGIYDADGDLIIISKLSKPIKLTPGNTVMIELSMDF